MNILLIQREGVDLHHTLFASETSRMALRFYHPKKKSCGVYITVSTLGSALSLVSELRWYTRRYVKETLFEVNAGIFCTRTLAKDVYYERTAVLGPTWPFRRLYGFRNGKLISRVVMSPGSTTDEYHQEYIGIDRTIECWCTEDELEDGEPVREDDGHIESVLPEEEE
ncbi:MAG TPA: DUF5804 family protein [Methanoregula sp.]|nr:DUF5804 family protein [Methanoregula sp.]